ncbi:hypothetical protein [Clostridium cochlearium]|uniref:Uncharacterized protein n=1 Tax=Clostridium cochlearium TaxID=1494 RepID=A0A2X2W625_CLOCO|nr:hypothetical protein [Clostridium cochlearium]SQB33411.1 Uncharacterised protein [Clostridium cochlearium]
MMEKNEKKLAIYLLIASVISLFMAIYFILKQKFNMGISFIFIAIISCILSLILAKELKHLLKLISLVVIINIEFIMLGVIANSLNFIFQENMLNFYGTILGSLIAGMLGIGGTIWGTKVGGKKAYEGSIAVLKEEIKYQNGLKQEKEKENKKNVIRIVTKFLKNEIIKNRDRMEKISFYEHLQKGFGTQYTYKGLEIVFDSYERVKYELIKYSDEKLVEEVIDLYDLLYMLDRYDDINQLKEEEYKKVFKLEYKIDNILKKIETQNEYKNNI